MPTGYTHNVGDGTLTDFPAFAMQCARAFGALVTMRDEPSSTEIPEKFEPTDYYAKELGEARDRLAQLKAMTVDQREAAAVAALVEGQQTWDRYEAKKAEMRARYETMLAHVRAWTPPTSEHVEMKRFMEEQLVESIDFDCGPPYRQRPTAIKRDEWHAKQVADAEDRIRRYEDENRKEIERCAGRTKWVRDLRASLK